MEDEKNINANKLTPQEKTVKTPKTSKRKNAARALLISTLMFGPSVAKSQYSNPSSPMSPLNPTHPANSNRPGHNNREKENEYIKGLKDANYKHFAKAKFDQKNLTASEIGLTESEITKIEQEFDDLFKKIVSSQNTRTEDIFLKTKELGEKYNLTDDQLGQIFINYIETIHIRKDINRTIYNILKMYTKEELQEKIEHIKNYKGDMSMRELCKKEFKKVYKQEMIEELLKQGEEIPQDDIGKTVFLWVGLPGLVTLLAMAFYLGRKYGE